MPLPREVAATCAGSVGRERTGFFALGSALPLLLFSNLAHRLASCFGLIDAGGADVVGGCDPGDLLLAAGSGLPGVVGGKELGSL